MTFQFDIATEQRQPVQSPVEIQGPFAQFGVRMSFAKDEEIYAQEEPAELLYQLVSGSIRTTRLSSDGRRQVGDFYHAGDIFGIEKDHLHRYSAEALTNCVVLVVKRTALELAAGRDALDHLTAAATRAELSRAEDHLLLLGRKTACEKVASFLLEQSDRLGRQAASLPMGRQDMADYLNLTIETVSRMVSQLQASGVVQFTNCRQFVIRNRAALERLGG